MTRLVWPLAILARCRARPPVQTATAPGDAQAESIRMVRVDALVVVPDGRLR